MRTRVKAGCSWCTGLLAGGLLLVPGAAWAWQSPSSQPVGPAPRGEFSIAAAQDSPFDISSNGKVLAAAEADGSVVVADVTTGQVLRTLPSGQSGGPLRLRLSPDGELLAAAGESAELDVWDVSTGALLASPHVDVESLAFSPDDRWLAVGQSDSTMNISILDARSGVVLRSWSAGPQGYGGVYSLAFTPDGRNLISGQGHEQAKEWTLITGALIRTLPGELPFWNRNQGVAFSPDGRYVALEARSACEVVDLTSGVIVGEVAKGLKAEPLAFSTDGLELMVLAETAHGEEGPQQHEIEFWDFQSGNRVADIPLGSYPDFASPTVLMSVQSSTVARFVAEQEIDVAKVQ